MKRPGIPHFGIPAIIDTDPSVKNPNHDFEQKQDDQLGFAETRAGKKLHFGYQPGK